MHRKLAFSTLSHDTLGIIPLAAGVVITLRTSAKILVRNLIDYTTYISRLLNGKITFFSEEIQIFDLWILLIIVNVCSPHWKWTFTNQVESYLMMVQCFKAWILSTVPVACRWLLLPQNTNMAAPRAGKDDVKRQGVWFCIFVCFRLFYSPEIIPSSLVFYLDNAHYCICGSACFEMFMKRFDSLHLNRIANTLAFSENVGTTVQAETFYCSRKCVKLIT